MLPREHGAYGQALLPLLTAFAAAGSSTGGLCVAATVLAGLLAHEPAAILLGTRGPRARREQGDAAVRWLSTCVALGALSASAALWLLPPPARWSMLVPAVPALVLLGAMLRHHEKSWYSETAAALAFSTAALPVVLAAGQPLDVALLVAVPFALLFVTTTLGVRAVILRVRGGGDERAAANSRVWTMALALVSAGLLTFAARRSALPWAIVFASAPGLTTAIALAMRPPPPTRLRMVGWTLVAVSALTAILVVTTA